MLGIQETATADQARLSFATKILDYLQRLDSQAVGTALELSDEVESRFNLTFEQRGIAAEKMAQQVGIREATDKTSNYILQLLQSEE